MDIPEEERERILSALRRMLDMGIGVVYGQEDEGIPDAAVDCKAYLFRCKAVCCTFNFALTKEEVGKGRLRHDPGRPFFMARDEDGYCAHIDRGTLECAVYEDRPLRCRRYGCGETPGAWPDKGAED
jgi:Fe-S-cluster containining protein